MLNYFKAGYGVTSSRSGKLL